jgi:hypothetical protein
MPITTKSSGDLLTAAEVNTIDDALDAVISSNAGKQDVSAKNAANGYAGLGSDSKIAVSQIPTITTSLLSDFAEASQDVIGAMVAAAGGTYTHAAGTITFPAGGAIVSTSITDSTATGRGLLTAANPTAALGVLGINSSGNFADGSASAPGAPWLNDTNTGFFRPSADVLGFAAGGAAVATMAGVANAANSLALSNAATTAAPSIAAVGSDANIDLVLAPKAAGYVTTARPLAAPRFFSSKTGAATTISYGGTVENLEDSGFFMNFTLNGTVHTALTSYEQISPMRVNIFDQANVTLSDPLNTGSGDLLAGWNLEMTVDPPTPSGQVYAKGRIGMRSFILAGSLVGNAGYLPIVGIEAKAQTNGNQGGVGGWDPATSAEEPKFYTRGAIFGLNTLAIISGTATNIGSVQSIEANWSALSGTSVNDKVGLRLVTLSNDIVQGTEVDAGITLSVKGATYGVPTPTAAAIRTGIQFGVPSGFWPFSSDSIAIAAVGRGSGRGTIGRPATIPGVGSTQTNLPLLRFLDMAEVLTTDCQILGRGFRLEPLGDIVWTPRTAAPTLSVNGQLCIYAVSNTGLRVRYRGSDGVTREVALPTLS